MPGRNIPLVTNEIYHIVDRGIASQPVFLHQDDFERALETIFYYRNKNIPVRYSFFLRLPQYQRDEILKSLEKEKKYLVDIISYCLMPTHPHLLLKQLEEGGISTFMSNVLNSYTRWFNTVNERTGPLFQGKFKAIRIATDNQLIHVNRYIHLNPFSGYVVKKITDIENYPYSSYSEFLGKKQGICHKDLVLNYFKNIVDYKKFVMDQADYQRKLENIKHLTLEKRP